METVTMGKVVVSAKIENMTDAMFVREGIDPHRPIRTVQVNDALVDTGATMLSLPQRLITELGLRRVSSRTARTPAGIMTFPVYEVVRLTVQDRDCELPVCELPDSCPVLIGQIPLEHLQLVVNMANHRLETSPANGGEWILDLF